MHCAACMYICMCIIYVHYYIHTQYSITSINICMLCVSQSHNIIIAVIAVQHLLYGNGPRPSTSGISGAPFRSPATVSLFPATRRICVRFIYRVRSRRKQPFKALVIIPWYIHRYAPTTTVM